MASSSLELFERKKALCVSLLGDQAKCADSRALDDGVALFFSNRSEPAHSNQNEGTHFRRDVMIYGERPISHMCSGLIPSTPDRLVL